ncbi:MAG: M23 family metallopeptidase [Chloroflexi bacterium]|nr:M23 family metallopeptidase [Chloroflexota bacterium]
MAGRDDPTQRVVNGWRRAAGLDPLGTAEMQVASGWLAQPGGEPTPTTFRSLAATPERLLTLMATPKSGVAFDDSQLRKAWVDPDPVRAAKSANVVLPADTATTSGPKRARQQGKKPGGAAQTAPGAEITPVASSGPAVAAGVDAPDDYGRLPLASGGTAIEQAIDHYSAGDSRIATAMRLGVLLETGSFESGGSAVGDSGQSHGWYQIHQPAHSQYITPEQSRDPYAATKYMLRFYQAGVERVDREQPGLWQRDPYGAARLAAFYAEKPSQMYPEERYQRAKARLTSARSGGGGDAPYFAWLGEGASGSVTGRLGDTDEVYQRTARGGKHTGVDIGIAPGAPVITPVEGVVEIAGQYGGYGTAVVLRLASGRRMVLGHLSGTSVRPGQTVAKGAVLGRSGNSGVTDGPHLHLELREADGTAIDPRHYAS